MNPLQFLVACGACKRGVEYVEKEAFETFAQVFERCPRADWLCWMLDAALKVEKGGTFEEHAWEREHWKIFLAAWSASSAIAHVANVKGSEGRCYEALYYLFRGWDDYHKLGAEAVAGALVWKEAYTLRRFLFNLRQALITAEDC